MNYCFGCLQVDEEPAPEVVPEVAPETITEPVEPCEKIEN